MNIHVQINLITTLIDLIIIGVIVASPNATT